MIPKDKQEVISAARLLNSFCDGALAKDGVGYNGRDAPFVKDVLTRSDEDITDRQAIALYNILRTYTKQLARNGIDYSSLKKPKESPKAKVDTSGIEYHKSWDTLDITFGKHSGKSIGRVFKEDPDYLKWLAEKAYQEDIKQAAKNVLAGKPVSKPKVKLDFKAGEIHIYSPYSERQKCRDLSERKWRDTNWVAPARIIKEVIAAFPEAELTEAFTSEVERIKKLTVMSDKADTTFDIEHFGNGKKMMPFQRAGVEFVEEADGKALIADQMGLGKTIQALAYLQLHEDLRPAIIVAPASLKNNWKQEAERWLETDDTIYICSGRKPEEMIEEVEKHSIVIINYDILPSWVDALTKNMRPQIIIYDESHNLKNSASKRTQAAAVLSSRIPQRLLLTGTPVLNRPNELWTQLNIIDPERYDNFFRFGSTYCNATYNGYGWDFSGASNIEQLAEELRGIMIRRTKDQVLEELPEKTRSLVPIEISNRREYNRVESEFLDWLEEQKGKEAADRASKVEQITKIEYLKQVAAKGKIHESINWIKDFLHSGEKLVVFATHREVIDKLFKAFGRVAVKIDGSVPVDRRQEIVEQFQTDPKIRLFIGNIQAAGVGLTLTAASNVAFLELGWTPALHDQAEDRCHRIGQKDAVNIYYLLAEETIDERIAELLEDKRKVVDAVMSDKNDISFDLFSLFDD